MSRATFLLALGLAQALSACGASSAPAAPAFTRSADGVVALTCATPGAVIRYSLDGTDPGPMAGPYLAPIELPSGGVVKARAFSADRALASELLDARIEPVPGAAALPATCVPCTQDRDAPVYDWPERHAAVARLVRERKPALLFLGDSITHMFGGEPADRPQPGREVWERHYAGRNAANLGFGYDRVENLLWRLQHGELDGAAAKAVVIHIGTNNVGRDSAEDIAAGIRAVCAEVRRRQPQAAIVLLAIFPRSARPDALRAGVDAVNRLLAELDGKDGVTVLDLGPRFLEPDGSLAPEIMGDFLHPTAKGYEIWARELEPTLERLLGPAPR